MKALLLLVLLAAPAFAQGQGWELKVPERVELAAGTSAPLAVAISLDRGLTISKDAQLILDLAPDAAVTVKKRRLGRADAVDPEADAPRFSIALRSETTGDYTVKLRVRFWLCGQKACRPVDARRTIAVAVTPQTPAP